jgi:hypothetical protein
LRGEIFFIAYHLHWGAAEVLDLPTEERWAYVKLVSNQLERERDELNKARRTR